MIAISITDFNQPSRVTSLSIHVHRLDEHSSRGTKVEKMLTLAPERYTAEFCMVAEVILWCI